MDKVVDRQLINRRSFLELTAMALASGLIYDGVFQKAGFLVDTYSSIESWLHDLEEVASGGEKPTFILNIKKGESVSYALDVIENINSEVPIELVFEGGEYVLGDPKSINTLSMVTNKELEQEWGKTTIFTQDVLRNNKITIRSEDPENPAVIITDSDVGILFDECSKVELKNINFSRICNPNRISTNKSSDALKGIVVASGVRSINVEGCTFRDYGIAGDLKDIDTVTHRGLVIVSKWKKSIADINKSKFVNIPWDGILGVGEEVVVRVQDTSFIRNDDVYRIKDKSEHYTGLVGTAASCLWGAVLEIRQCGVYGYNKCFGFSNIAGGFVDGLKVRSRESSNINKKINGYWVFGIFGRTNDRNVFNTRGDRKNLTINNLDMCETDVNGMVEPPPYYQFIIYGNDNQNDIPLLPQTAINTIFGENWNIPFYAPYMLNLMKYPIAAWPKEPVNIGNFLIDRFPKNGYLKNINIARIHTSTPEVSDSGFKDEIKNPKSFEIEDLVFSDIKPNWY